MEMKWMKGSRRWLGAMAVAMSTGFLMACGGGGNTDSQGNLVVGFDYPTSPAPSYNVLDNIAIQPKLTGLGSETPNFTWDSWNNPPPPSTLQLNRRTGEVTGYVAESGSHYYLVRLTVSGYQDYIQTPVRFDAKSSFVILYGNYLWPTRGQLVVPKATNLSVDPIGQPKWTGLQAGDTVTYRLLPKTDPYSGNMTFHDLPVGMGFSTSTGAFSGFMADVTGYQYGELNVRVEATINRAGKTAKLVYPVTFKNY